jgi:hypothetical protein
MYSYYAHEKGVGFVLCMLVIICNSLMMFHFCSFLQEEQWTRGKNGTSKMVEMVALILLAYHFLRLLVIKGVPLGGNDDYF